MTEQDPAPSSGVDLSPSAEADESPATEDETRKVLLDRAVRPAAPVLKDFVQNPDKRLKYRGGPLSVFVKNGDLRGLKAFLFAHAIISSGAGDNGWSTTLPLGAWARALDTTTTASPRSATTSATKILARLEDRKLIERSRQGRERKVTVTLLRPDGSGSPYTRPGKGNDDRWLQLDNCYWTDGWHEKLDLPALAMLLVALHERPGFELVTERVPDWYGWSADTAERGLRTLAEHGLLHVAKRAKKAPLSPTGVTVRNVYTLRGPFERPTAPPEPPAKSAKKKRGRQVVASSDFATAFLTGAGKPAKKKSVVARKKKAK